MIELELVFFQNEIDTMIYSLLSHVSQRPNLKSPSHPERDPNFIQ